MKIAHITYYYNDGYGYQDNILPIYQRKLGCETVLITSDRKAPIMARDLRLAEMGEYIDDTSGNRIIRLPTSYEFRGRFVAMKGLEQAMSEEKPDYIFHHGLTAPSLITAAKYKQKHPSVFLAADNHADYHNSGQHALWRLLYYRGLCRQKIQKIADYVDVFFSMTPGSKAFAERELGVPREKHRLLYLGADVDTNYFSSEWREKIRKNLGFDEKDLALITAGKIDRKKKTTNIVRALKDISSDIVKLVIVGTIESSYEQELDELIKGDPRIRKIGWIEANELYKYFSAADMAVFPGGQSAIWQQAISCELPVILKYWPGTEYLIDRNNGVFLFSDDPRELRQYLDFLTSEENSDILRSMKSGAIRERDEVLSYELIARQTLEVFDGNHE